MINHKITFTLLLVFLGFTSIFAQTYPMQSFSISYIHRSCETQISQPANQPTSNGDLKNTLNAQGVAIGPIYFSFIDRLICKNDDNKKIRFGDIIGLMTLNAGKAKVPGYTESRLWFGLGVCLGAFVLYHPQTDIGVGLKYRLSYETDGYTTSGGSENSGFGYYKAPTHLVSLFGHYKAWSSEITTSLSSIPDDKSLYNETSEVKYHRDFSFQLKYMFGKQRKFFAFGQYDYRIGKWWLYHDVIATGENVIRNDKTNTWQIGLGMAL